MEDFDENINFYMLCLLLGGNAVYEILKDWFWERRSVTYNIFQSLWRESSFPIS